jgi:predicted DCC family thiol-disulfide oxidoreductase YuxK
LEVLKCLPVPWRWLSVLLVIPTSIRDWFYNLIARNRYRVWGKSSLCLMPSTETQGRFL